MSSSRDPVAVVRTGSTASGVADELSDVDLTAVCSARDSSIDFAGIAARAAEQVRAEIHTADVSICSEDELRVEWMKGSSRAWMLYRTGALVFGPDTIAALLRSRPAAFDWRTQLGEVQHALSCYPFYSSPCSAASACDAIFLEATLRLLGFALGGQAPAAACFGAGALALPCDVQAAPLWNAGQLQRFLVQARRARKAASYEPWLTIAAAEIHRQLGDYFQRMNLPPSLPEESTELVSSMLRWKRCGDLATLFRPLFGDSFILVDMHASSHARASEILEPTYGARAARKILTTHAMLLRWNATASASDGAHLLNAQAEAVALLREHVQICTRAFHHA